MLVERPYGTPQVVGLSWFSLFWLELIVNIMDSSSQAIEDEELMQICRVRMIW